MFLAMLGDPNPDCTLRTISDFYLVSAKQPPTKNNVFFLNVIGTGNELDFLSRKLEAHHEVKRGNIYGIFFNWKFSVFWSSKARDWIRMRIHIHQKAWTWIRIRRRSRNTCSLCIAHCLPVTAQFTLCMVLFVHSLLKYEVFMIMLFAESNRCEGYR